MKHLISLHFVYILTKDYISSLTEINLFGDSMMDKTLITIFSCSIVLMLTFLIADVNEKGEYDFLKINPKIQNEELRTELVVLRKEFKTEKIRIQEYYNEKMMTLQKEKKNEITTLKTDFSGRRDIIMKKYAGEKRGNFIKKPSNVSPAVINVPDHEKVTKDKKKNRKP